MNSRRLRFLAAALIVAASFTASRALFAQAIFLNPPCATVTVTNNSPCTVLLNFVTVPAGIWPPFTMPPGTARFLPVPGPGVRVAGLVTPAGPAIALNPPPSPFAICGPGSWWLAGVPLDPTNPACLANICVDPATCSITVF